MSVEQIVKYSGGILLLLLTFIQISPIKINPWSWIGKGIGKVLNQDLVNEIKNIKKVQHDDQEENDRRLSALENAQKEFQAYYKEDDAKSARRRIISCADELRRGVEHSQEFFDDVLQDISYYNNYCKENPNFENMKAVVAIEFIKETYQHCLKENKFL